MSLSADTDFNNRRGGDAWVLSIDWLVFCFILVFEVELEVLSYKIIQ